MEVGIVGLPRVGKTMLFGALTAGHATSSGGGGGGGAPTPHVGMAQVPDPRLGLINSFIETKKVVHAAFQLVDIPGFAAGGDGGGFARAVLAHVRQVDAICHVVRCFQEPGADALDPAGDVDAMDTELIFSDLAVAEPAADKATRGARSGDPEIKARLAALKKVIPVLEDGRPIRSMTDLTDEDDAALRGFGMITAKPVLYVANIAESELGGSSAAVDALAAHVGESGGGSGVVTLCANLEAEIAELEDADRQEMLESMGLAEPALAVVARALYDRLGLTSFYTAGPKEVRAWAVRHGAPAPEAAGVIHSDIQRGFIRAECYHVDELAQYRSEKAIKEAGKLRSEGKTYQLQDGDVVHFLFNV